MPTEEPETEIPPQQPIFEAYPAPTIADSVTRAVCLVDELDVLPELVDEIEMVGESSDVSGITDGIRELIDHLRAQAAALVCLVDRLERIAVPL
jgi:hypothetical protein